MTAPAAGTAARPGGLTALAVLNFVFGGLGLIFCLLGVVGLSAIMALGGSGVVVALISLVLGLVGSVLMIIAGVGYLKMKKSARMMANGYAVLAIINAILSIAMLGGGVVGNIIGLAYAGVTLFAVNMAFKDKLVN